MLYQSSHGFDVFVQTQSPISSTVTCEINGQSKEVDLEFKVFQIGDITNGFISFHQFNIKGSLKTDWKPTSVSLQRGDDFLSTRILIRADLVDDLFPPQNFIRTCIGDSDPTLTLLGNVQPECSETTGLGTFNIDVSADKIHLLTGVAGTPPKFGLISCGGIPSSNGDSYKLGTQKNDNRIGTSGNDCIDGGKGNDKIAGLAGNDKLNGGDGKDLLVGGNGNDELTGGKGADSFNCGAGVDKITDFKSSEGDKKTNDCEQF